MKVINLFGGPGTGKSTTAAGLFALMKMRDINCELVTEQAKSFTWEERAVTLECQPYIFGKQLRDIWRLRNKVDYSIVDSPLLLSRIYGNKDKWPNSFFSYILDQFNSFNNINIFLSRIKPYNPIGRNQNEDRAREIDREIRKLLLDTNTPFYIIEADKNAPMKIFEKISKND